MVARVHWLACAAAGCLASMSLSSSPVRVSLCISLSISSGLAVLGKAGKPTSLDGSAVAGKARTEGKSAKARGRTTMRLMAAARSKKLPCLEWHVMETDQDECRYVVIAAQAFDAQTQPVWLTFAGRPFPPR